MTLPPDDDRTPDDRSLTEFLKRHRPPVPPPAAGLEDRVMAQIDRVPLQRSRRRSSVWLVPPAIAASLVAALLGYRSFAPGQLSASETANLEAFLETNWYAATDAPENSFLLPDPPQN